ncbi:MAG: SRPBCC family protein [Fimbriimonadaceae bacterium]|nr:MAG: SRPBCC family protein [Fimbriimonadaceae bacterium]
MPTVNTSVWINAPLDRVYAIARDNRSFPEFMEDVESLEIVSEEGDTVVSDWVGRVPAFGLKVRWTQEDVWDHDAHSCEFTQVKGDYDKMVGSWKFAEENGGTRFDSVLEYEYVVPGLGTLVGKVIYGLVVKNMEGVLGAIKSRAEAPE